MGRFRISSAFAAFLLMAAPQFLIGAASPKAVIGPQAKPTLASGPTAGLFTCQVEGLNSSATCYDPYQIRHAYGIDTLLDAGFTGAGKTIVIIDAFQSPNIAAELNAFNTQFAIPSLNGLGGSYNRHLGTFTLIAPNGLTPFDPANNDMQGWASEISLDVQWAHAIAPGANIVLVLAKSDQDQDLLDATKYVVDHRLGDIISQSYGEDESCTDPKIIAKQHALYIEATLKSMTIFASSGDDGVTQASCDGSKQVKAVSSPAVDPLVTGVGGTELHAASYCVSSTGCDPSANPAPGTYEGEIAWNESAEDFGASGGGFSVLFNRPAFQLGTVKHNHRGVPDVSYNAAVLHGVLVYLDIPGMDAGFYLFGGTSSGSPQWSALIAIADQRAGYDLGFINQALYGISQRRSYAASFHDITSGNNTFAGITGFNAKPGWDAVTGLGSPMGEKFVDELIKTASPLDGLIGVLEGGPDTGNSTPKPGHMKPH